MRKGSIFIISGPSGSGKDTVLRGVLEKYNDIDFSISSITRPMRGNEKDGDKYHFISVEEFRKMIEEDKLLEYNEFVGNYYGTPREPVEECIANGRDMIIEVDVNGARQIREKRPDAISVFIMPPSLTELKNRLINRGTETIEVIEKRIEVAIYEITHADEYDYIVLNDVLDDAIDDFNSVIANERVSVKKQSYLIEKVLNS